MAINNPQSWQSRLQGLNLQLKELETMVDGTPCDRHPILQRLVRCLITYANGTFEFFRDGFTNDTIPSSAYYPPEHQLRSVINQAYEDVLLIKHIHQQRQSARLGARLSFADRLAWDALQPAIQANLVENNVTVLVYFHKFPQIRVIPYAPIALIGIPFTAISADKDLLAIPHEVGHFVYRQGTYPANANGLAAVVNNLPAKYDQWDPQEKGIRNILSKLVSEEPAYAKGWLEELFADFYGCRIGGPAIASVFQELQLDFSLKRFRMNDGDHPSPILRPYVYTEVLSLNPALFDWAEKLKNLWDARRLQRESELQIWREALANRTDDPDEKAELLKDRTGQFYYDDNSPLNIMRSLSVMPGIQKDYKAVDRVLLRIDELLASVSNEDWDSAAWWQSGVQAIGINEDVYTRLSHFVANSGEFNLGNLNPDPEADQCAANLIDDAGQFDQATLDAMIPDWPARFFPGEARPSIANPDPDQTEVWWVYDVLFRAGWNTFGNGDWIKGP